MTLSFVDVAKAPITIPAFDLLREPEGAAFDFISGKAWIVDKAKPANTMLRNIGEVLSNPGASATKVLRRKSGKLESLPWWANEYDGAGSSMGMRAEGQRVRLSKYPIALDNAAWSKGNCVVTPTGQPGILGGSSFKLAATAARPALRQSGSSGSATLWCGWGIVEAAEWQYATIGRGNGAGLWTCLTFDLLTGQMVNNTGAASQPGVLEWGSINLGSGRWLIWMRTNEVGGNFYLGPSYSASGYLYQGSTFPYDGVAGIIVHAIEVEDGPFPTSPILAGEAAAATRAADQPQISTGLLPYNPAAGTLILEGMAYDYDNGLENTALRLGTGTTHRVDLIKFDTSTRNSGLRSVIRVNGAAAEYGEISGAAFPVQPTPKKIGVTWDAASQVVASGATGSLQETASFNWVPTDLGLLRFGVANGLMWHRSAVYIPRKLTAAELLARVSA